MLLQKLWLTVGPCLVIACAVAALADAGAAQSVSSLAPTGTHRVGTLSLRLVDVSRSDPFLENGTKRELMVRFWYPSAPNANCRLSEYASPKIWAYLSQLSGFPLPNVTTHSCLNAIITEGSHPVLLFSHGYTGTFTDSTFLFEDLASRGYLVVSIAHTYESTAVEFPDGRLTKSVFGSYLDGDSLRTDEQSLRLARSVRLADLRFVFDELQRLNRSGGFFAVKLDLARAGVMGHSFGGEVALSSLQSDPRLGAAVLLDAPITDEDTGGTAKPLLILAGRERWSNDECRLWSNLRGPRLAVTLRGAEHLTPSDALWLFKDMPGLAVPAGSMGAEKTVILLRNLVAGFFDTHLRGTTLSPRTSRPVSEFRDVVVTTQNQPLCHARITDVRGTPMIRYFVLALVMTPLAISHKCGFKLPAVTLSPNSVNFFPQVVNPGGAASEPKTATLTNSGSAALKITNVVSSGDFSQTNDCPMDPDTIAPNASCTIHVTFTPNVIGKITGAVTITDNGIGNPHVLALSGTGLPPVGFSPADLDFGAVAVGSSASQTVTLTNNQSTNLIINSIVPSGDYSQTNDCPTPSLSAGQSCTVIVKFHPMIAASIPGALTVSTDAFPGTQPVGLTGSGSGSAASHADLSPANLAFGNHEAGTLSGGKTVTLTNTGNSSLSIQSISASGGYQSTNTCGTLVSAGGTCTITVKFQPSADFANVDYPGAITIVDSDASTQQVVGLSGTGVTPVTASPAAVDFGTFDPNSTAATQSVTITNHHNAAEDLSITTSGHFDLSSGGCTQSLPSGGHCTAEVAFTSASQTGTQTGSMTITPSSASFLNPTVVGLSACATQVAVSPRNFNFGAVAVDDTSSAQTTTISNAGSDLNISGISITGTDSRDFAISNNTCGSTLPSAASCTLEIAYKPQASGTRTAVLSISDDGACSPQQETLTGGSSAGPFRVFVNLNEVTANGTVTSTPPGINCGGGGSDCAASFPSGTTVTLSPTPESAFRLSWSGACSGISSCVLTMDADKQVTATINRNPELILMITGNGGGSVTSSPSGIACSAPSTTNTNCVADFPVGATVTLTAAPDSNSAFAGWSGGGCSGTGKCSFTSSSDQTFTATFNSTAPGFSMSASSAAPGTVSAGQSAQSTVTITSVNAFNSEVKFTCSVDPAPGLAPTCSMNPPSVTPAANGSVNSTLTISTTAASASGAVPARGSLLYALSLPLAGIAWFTVGLPSRKRKIRLAVLLVCSTLAAGVLLETSCGGAGTKTIHGVGTPANTYTITVTGAAGSTQHSTTTTLTVH